MSSVEVLFRKLTSLVSASMIALSVVGLSFGPTIALAEDVLINEFMANPDTSSAVVLNDASGEWIELTNTSETDVDISGWKLLTSNADGSGTDEGVFPTPTTIKADASLVACNNDALSENGGVVCDVVVTLNLVNSGGIIELLDSSDILIDTIEYSATTDGASEQINRDESGNQDSTDPTTTETSTTFGPQDNTVTAQNGNPAQNCITNNDNPSHYYATIQEAIDDAAAGDQINICAGDHTVSAQVVINKDITLKGTGIDTTRVIAGYDTGSSADSRGWFLVETGTTFNIADLTLDGDSTNGTRVYQALRFIGGGSVDAVKIQNVKWGTYTGFGLAALGSAPVSVTNSVFLNIERVGATFYYSGASNSSFENNSYTGKGNGDWIDYAVEVGGGAADVIIRGNAISGNSGTATSDGSSSAGILVSTYFGDGSSALIENNFINNNSTGVYVGFNASDTSSVVLRHNHLADNDAGLRSTAPLIDASVNWWGTAAATSINVDHSEVDFTPLITRGGDVSSDTGYQPNLTDLTVHTLAQQIGSTGRIQEGINSVSGSTVNVANGTYDENLLLNVDNLILRGESKNGVIVNSVNGGTAAASNEAVSVRANNITINKFTFNISGGDTSTDWHIKPYNVTGFTIKNVAMNGPGQTDGRQISGLDMNSVSDVLVRNTQVQNYDKNGVALTAQYDSDDITSENIQFHSVRFLNNGASSGWAGLVFYLNGGSGTSTGTDINGVEFTGTNVFRGNSNGLYIEGYANDHKVTTTDVLQLGTSKFVNNSNYNVINLSNGDVDALDALFDGVKGTEASEAELNTIESGILHDCAEAETRFPTGECNPDDSYTGLVGTDGIVIYNADNEAPSAPSALFPGNNQVINANDLFIDWSDSTDDFTDQGDIRYEYRLFTVDPEANPSASTRYAKDYTGTTRHPAAGYASGTQEDSFWWRVRACDEADNCSDWTASRKFVVDNTAPVVSINSPEEDALVSGTVSINATISDDNADHYFLRITEESTGSEVYSNTFHGSPQDFDNYEIYEWDTTGLNGEYRIFLSARDAAGNKDGDRNTDGDSVDSVVVNVDNTAPEADAGPDETVEGQTASLDGSSSSDNEGIDTYQWELISGPSPTSTADFDNHEAAATDVTVNEFGTYVFELTVADEAGNQHSDEVSVTFTEPDSTTDSGGDNGGDSQTNGQSSTEVNTLPQTTAFTATTANQFSTLGTDGTGNDDTQNDQDNTEDETTDGTETTEQTTNTDNEDNGEVAAAQDDGGFTWWWILVILAIGGILYYLYRQRNEEQQA